VPWRAVGSGAIDGRSRLNGMDGLGQAVGNGITGLVGGAFDAIGGVLRGMVNAGNQALPNGLFWVVIFVVLLAGAWTLVKR
jgi:hypothetical protein